MPIVNFYQNVISEGLCNKIIPIKLSTLEAANSLNVMADLIYVDASHDEESVYQDIMHWYPKLNKNGIICGDDWGLSWKGVQKGVSKAAIVLNKVIKTVGRFWYFEPDNKADVEK